MAEDANLGMRGVRLVSRRIKKDDRGTVMHGLRADEAFGPVREVYFSTVAPNVVKAWHLHYRMTLRYLCVYGRVMVGLVDGRERKTPPLTAKVFLSPSEDEYQLLIIPPGVWNGYRSMTDSMAIVCNIADDEHDPTEIIRVHPKDAEWTFDWGPYNLAG